MPSKHALLSPSSSKRWMTCTPSARLEALYPSKDTVYTLEGTYAHAVAETLLRWCLECGFDATPDLDHVLREYQNPKSRLFELLDPLGQKISDEGFDFSEMLSVVHERYVIIVYSEYLNARAKDAEAVLLVEAELKLDTFIPEGFGSSDAVILSDDRLRVFDLKYGKGVKVNAFENTQMMCYALGAYCGPGEPYLINHVEMTIVQPRLNHVSTWEMRADILYNWGLYTLRPVAQAAYQGIGKFTPGEHCRFCKAAHSCKALAAFCESAVAQGNDTTVMSPEELSQMLGKLGIITDWAAAVQEYALKQALDGKPLPGWKVVEGRSVRKISDTKGAVARLVELGWDEDQCYKPRELKTITDLERMVGKKQFPGILGDLVAKTQGKPTLVPESDPRPAYSSMNEDFKDC